MASNVPLHKTSSEEVLRQHSISLSVEKRVMKWSKDPRSSKLVLDFFLEWCFRPACYKFSTE